jgi:hypothetical protein
MKNPNIAKMRERISKALEVFYKAPDDMSLEDIKDVIRPHLNDLIYLYETCHLPEEDDWRSGAETYGYEGSPLGDLQYIADRWGAAFRIRWMIDLVDNEYYAYREVEK